MRKITIAGEEVTYKSYGEGRPLVLLHGFGGSHSDWDRVARELDGSGYEIIIPNFTSLYLRPDRKMTFSQQAHIVRSFVEIVADKNGRVSLAGVSYGGALGWAVAMIAPSSIEKLVLINPMPPKPLKRFRDKVLKSFLFLSRQPKLLGAFLLSPAGRAALPHLERLFRFSYAQTTDKRKRRVAHVTRRKISVIIHVIQTFSWICRQENWAFWESRLSEIQAPVRLIWGNQDKLFEPRIYRALDRLFKNSEFIELNGGKHMMVRECPEDVATHILEFLEARHLKIA